MSKEKDIDNRIKETMEDEPVRKSSNRRILKKCLTKTQSPKK